MSKTNSNKWRFGIFPLRTIALLALEGLEGAFKSKKHEGRPPVATLN